MTDRLKTKKELPVKTKLRKSFNRLVTSPNYPLYIKRFCEALIDYQLYEALKNNDKHNNKDQTPPDEEALSDLRNITDLEIISETDEAEYNYQRSSLSKMYYNTDK